MQRGYLALRELATQVLQERSTPERLAALDRAGTWFYDSTCRDLAGAGVIDAAFGTDVGGDGLGLLELHYVLEQVGATTAHVPIYVLPGVVAGRTMLTAALTKPGSADPAVPELAWCEPTTAGPSPARSRRCHWPCCRPDPRAGHDCRWHDWRVPGRPSRRGRDTDRPEDH